MKITKILPQKNETAYNIYIDDEFSFSASLEDIIKYSIKEGTQIDNDGLERIILICEYSKAYDYCLKLLSIRDYVSEEIRKKLKLRSFSEKTIEKVINKLTEYNLLNDERYTEKYVNDCINIKKYGVNKIKNNLKLRGIDKAAIENINIDDEAQYRLCIETALKKDRMLGDCRNKKEKIFRFLISRGFEYETISKVLNNIADIKEKEDNNEI